MESLFFICFVKTDTVEMGIPLDKYIIPLKPFMIYENVICLITCIIDIDNGLLTISLFVSKSHGILMKETTKLLIKTIFSIIYHTQVCTP